jgi:DNA-binding NarL/FixJ family response regulator
MPLSVLIVDDHPGFRATARMLLDLEGYRVVGEAADGCSAVRAVRELRPELVVLDVNLPDIDGFEVSRRVTANGHSPAVVLVSSREGADFGPLIESSGARGFISKGDLSAASLERLLS